MKITNRKVAPLFDTFSVVFDFIACILSGFGDRISIFFLVVAQVIFCDHTKNQVFILSLRGYKNTRLSPIKVTTLRHSTPLCDTKHQSATSRIYRFFICRTIVSLFSRLETDTRRKREEH